MATVYALECLINGFAYIGVTSGKLGKRFREHRCMCNTHKHHAVRLTEDWHRYGESSFVMKALDEAEYSHRGAHCPTEQKWIDHYAKMGKLYNAIAFSAGGVSDPKIRAKGIEASRHAVGNRWTPEANLKRRLAQIGKPKGHGAKISATKQRNKQMMR